MEVALPKAGLIGHTPHPHPQDTFQHPLKVRTLFENPSVWLGSCSKEAVLEAALETILTPDPISQLQNWRLEGTLALS